MYAVDVDNFIQLNSVLTGTTDANATVKGNILFDNTITASAHTYLLESSSNFTLSSNGTFRGIDISSTTGFDIENLTMAGFSVVGRGGAIYGNALPDGTRTISNSYFLNNRSTDLGGAIYFLGTGTLKLDIRSTEFRNNRSTGSDGGAIRVGSAAQLEIADSFFIENEASASGGAIDYRGGNGNARRLSTIKNTEFISNKASGGSGGAIYATNNLDIDKSKFFKNIAKKRVVSDVTSGGSGGAIRNVAKINITGSDFIENEAEISGGAIHNTTGPIGASTDDIDGDMTIENSTFILNQAENGGAIRNDLGAKITIKGVANIDTFVSNTATDSGGAIDNRGLSMSIENVTFRRNSAVKHGGAIYNQDSNMTIRGSVFAGNTSGEEGGAIRNVSSATSVANLIIYDSTFSGNKATGAGDSIKNINGNIAIIATINADVGGAVDVVFDGDGNRVAIDNNSSPTTAMNFNAVGKNVGSGMIVFNDKIVTNGSAVLNINAPAGVSIVPVDAPTTGSILFNADMTGINGVVNFHNGTIVVGDKGTLFSDGTRTVIMASPTTPQVLDMLGASAARVYNLGALTLNNNLIVKTNVDLANATMASLNAKSVTGFGGIEVNELVFSSSANTKYTSILFANEILKDKVDYTGSEKIFQTGYKFKYRVGYGNNGVIDGRFYFTQIDPMTVSTRLELSDVLEDRFADIFIIKDFTHTGATFDIASDYDVSISGYGDLKNISGLNQSAFNVQDGGKLQLANLNFSNFDTSISGNVVKVESGGILNVLDSSFTSNTGSGSAIVNNGTLSVKTEQKGLVFDNATSAIANNNILIIEPSISHSIVFNSPIVQSDTSSLEISGNGTVVFNADMSEVKGAVNLNSGEMALGSAGTLFDSGTTFNANGGTLNLIQAVKNDASRINLGALNLASNLNIKTSVDLQNETMPMITAESVSGGGVIMVSSILLENEHDREISVVPFTTNTDLIDRVSTSVTKIAQPINIYDVSYESGNFIFTKAKGVNPSIQSSNVASQAAQIAQMGNFTHLFATLASRSHLSLKNDHEADEGDMWIRPYYSNEILKLDNLPKIKSTTYGALFGVDSQAFEYGDVGAIYTVYGGYNGGELRYNGDFENSNVKIRQNGGFVGGSVSLYSGDAFGAVAVNIGSLTSTITTDEFLQGDGKFNTFTAGVGFKGGVDFMPYEDFTIQPNLSLIYSYMESKTFENKAGTIISSGGLHAVQLSPSIKMMKNFDKQINSYLDLRGVFNLQNNPNSKADEYLLPKTALGAYGEVAIGVSRDYGNMSFFAQGTLRAFRREGYGVESGFRVKF